MCSWTPECRVSPRQVFQSLRGPSSEKFQIFFPKSRPLFLIFHPSRLPNFLLFLPLTCGRPWSYRRLEAFTHQATLLDIWLEFFQIFFFNFFSLPNFLFYIPLPFPLRGQNSSALATFFRKIPWDCFFLNTLGLKGLNNKNNKSKKQIQLKKSSLFFVLFMSFNVFPFNILDLKQFIF